MLNRVTAVAVATFRETVRDRLFYLVGFFGLLLVGAVTVLSPLTVGAQGKIVADVGLGGMSFLGLLVVLLVGANMVRKEMERRTITTILTKPVGRGEYLAGKYAGLALTLTCLVALMSLLYVGAVALTPAVLAWSHLAAVYLTLLELLVLCAAAVLFSALAGPALAALFAATLFAIGHLTESLLDFGALAGGPSRVLAAVAFRLLPDLEVFNVRAAVVHGDPVAAGHLALATLYAAGWIVVFLVLARAVFARKEL
ncbi:MAG TPA: ABC transporter permease subunit [Candidatus Krumholzibacteria bacterium]|nr:ABC transporter permease subunit [Candidatus Krumholzibacteria bacterium]HPD71461.1 ABC transporter permease subunit [Candidatus Krumholzibacteria bacterium]HRY41606.1 ABC transporter permease subunit [Candidatus Krumholzibacteria bacterium]